MARDERERSRVEPVFRLGHVLLDRKEQEGGFSQLAAKITEAWTGSRSGAPIVDRRKLRALVEDADKPDTRVFVSIPQLRALDAYLEDFNEGLAHRPLFSKPDLLRVMAEGREVVFLVGSKVVEHGVELSQWDVLSIAEIQRGINRYTTNVHVDLRDVLLAENIKEARSFEQAPWFQALEEGGRSRVCIGSPRSLHASELTLAQMFDVKPYEPTPDHDELLPFHFVRPHEKGRHSVPSRFDLRADQIRSLAPHAAVEVDKGAHALCVGDEVRLADRHDRKSILTYGIVAVQRRAPGEVWTVVAGLTGGATHACAMALDRMSANLPAAGSGPPPVLWAVVEAIVEEDPRRRGRGIYNVVRHSVPEEPRRWVPGSSAGR